MQEIGGGWKRKWNGNWDELVIFHLDPSCDFPMNEYQASR